MYRHLSQFHYWKGTDNTYPQLIWRSYLGLGSPFSSMIYLIFKHVKFPWLWITNSWGLRVIELLWVWSCFHWFHHHMPCVSSHYETLICASFCMMMILYMISHFKYHIVALCLHSVSLFLVCSIWMYILYYVLHSRSWDYMNVGYYNNRILYIYTYIHILSHGI